MTHQFERAGKYWFSSGTHYVGQLGEGNLLSKMMGFVTKGMLWDKLPEEVRRRGACACGACSPSGAPLSSTCRPWQLSFPAKQRQCSTLLLLPPRRSLRRPYSQTAPRTASPRTRQSGGRGWCASSPLSAAPSSGTLQILRRSTAGTCCTFCSRPWAARSGGAGQWPARLRAAPAALQRACPGAGCQLKLHVCCTLSCSTLLYWLGSWGRRHYEQLSAQEYFDTHFKSEEVGHDAAGGGCRSGRARVPVRLQLQRHPF